MGPYLPPAFDAAINSLELQIMLGFSPTRVCPSYRGQADRVPVADLEGLLRRCD